MKWQWQQAALDANENVNENFHPDNCQLSIINYQLARRASLPCHPKNKLFPPEMGLF